MKIKKMSREAGSRHAGKKRIYRRKNKNKPVAKIVTKGFWTKRRTAALIVAIFVGLGIVAGITGYYLSREEPAEAAINTATNDDGNYEAAVNGKWLGFEMKGGIKENSKKGNEQAKLTYDVFVNPYLHGKKQEGFSPNSNGKEFLSNLGETLKNKNLYYDSTIVKAGWLSVPAEILVQNNVGWRSIFDYVYASRSENWKAYDPDDPPAAWKVSSNGKFYLQWPKRHSRLFFDRKQGGEFDSDFAVYFEPPGPYIGLSLDRDKDSYIWPVSRNGKEVKEYSSSEWYDYGRATFCLRIPLTGLVRGTPVGEIKSEDLHLGFRMTTRILSAIESTVSKVDGKQVDLDGPLLDQQYGRDYRATWHIYNTDDMVEELRVKNMRGGVQSPQTLSASSVSGTTVNLRWDRSTGYNAYKYRIQRSGVSSTVWKEVRIVGNNKSSFKDTGLTKGKTYKYRVGAVNYYDGGKNFVYYWSPEVTITAGEGGVVAKPKKLPKDDGVVAKPKKLPKDDGVVAKPVSTDIPEDVNQDGYVNWLDVSRVLAYNGFPGAKVVRKPTREDVNSDSVVDWLDIGRILAYKGFPQTGAASKTKVAPVDSGSAPATKSKAIKAQ